MSETRRGAKRINDIPEDVLNRLNRGEMETANLVEWLAVDKKELLRHMLQESNRNEYLEPVLHKINQLKKETTNTVNATIGYELYLHVTQNSDSLFLSHLSQHRSDLVRCWAAYSIGKNKNLSIGEMLVQIRPFAADGHFGVREISWMVLRESIIANLKESISLLSEWALDPDDNVRRFASEATRPCGVWSKHIEELKQQPVLGLPILDVLKSDPSRYVQDSVGNWLNDASKSSPHFVKEVCERWGAQSKSKETHYILKKALRTLNK